MQISEMQRNVGGINTFYHDPEYIRKQREAHLGSKNGRYIDGKSGWVKKGWNPKSAGHFKGKHHTKEWFEAWSGKNAVNYKDGRSLKPNFCIDCGKKIGWRAAKCKSCAQKGSIGGFIGKHHTKKWIEKHSGKYHFLFGKHRTETVKRKIRETREMKGLNKPECNPFYGKHHTEETKKEIGRIRVLDGNMKGKNNPQFGKSAAHGKGAYYKGIWMRSSWEIEIAKWMDKRNWTWQYEPKRFFLKERTYAPDFYLPDLNVYWEIKGWFHERHQETIRQFRKLYPYERLVVITKGIFEKLLNL